MRAKINLLESMRTGEFGPLRLGMTRQQLLKIIGEPDCRPEPANRDDAPNIWVYDPIELYFDAGSGERLEAIFVDHLEEMSGCRHFEIDPWILEKGLPLEQAEFRLDQEELDYTVAPCAWNSGDAVEVTLGSGVKLSFLLRREYEEDQLGLYAITLRAPRGEEAEYQKVSVSISPELYRMAREAARAGNTSVASILRDIIERHADELEK